MMIMKEAQQAREQVVATKYHGTNIYLILQLKKLT